MEQPNNPELVVPRGTDPAVSPKVARPLPPGANRPASVPARQQRLEKLVAEAVARQTETLTETLVETIVQRVIDELAQRENCDPISRVEDSDPIDRLPLPTRVAKVMRRMGVRTVGQLTALREEDLMYLRNLGAASLRQLNRILALFGRSLAG